MSENSNRDLLLRTASGLFRRKGYDGVGLNEILAASGLPKGSLYYHFPGGKRELAEAATAWAGQAVETLVERIFAAATDFPSGAAAIPRAIADTVKQKGQVLACPVASILQAGTQDERLRLAARQVISSWTVCVAKHAGRLGHPSPQSAAESLIIQLEGAWLLALAEQNGGPLERLADRLSERAMV
ncbi:TetR/AcrR family transcriptional regulator [Xanthobacter sp. ZOL 2024]